MTPVMQYLGASIGAVLFLLYCTSSSWIIAIAVTMIVLIVGLLSFSAASFVLRLYDISSLPQMTHPETKKLSNLIWSGKYTRASADSELLTSLKNSYSQLPMVLGDKRRGLLIPAKVDAALEVLLDTFLNLYVRTWFSKVTDKPDFIEEMRHSFGCILRSLYERLLEADMAGMVSQRIAPVFLKHVYLTKKSSAKRNTKSVVNYPMSDLSRDLIASYAVCRRIHPAVTNTATEALYLRSLVDLLLPLLCPQELLIVQSGKMFLREAVASKLLSLVNYLANPVTMNKILFLWASPSRKFPASVSSWRLLLADYGWRVARTTPFLGFTLQEIRPERNNPPSQLQSRLLYAFQQFLRRRGSKYLDMYLLFQEISMEVIPVFFDARLLATADSATKLQKQKGLPSVRRNLYNKLQELYRAYVDPDASRSPSIAEMADEPVLGSDQCDNEGVELAQAWRYVTMAGQDCLVDPDTVNIFQRVEQYLENRLQPLIVEFNQSDLAVTVFKNISAAQGAPRDAHMPSRKQVVDTLVKGVYKYSSDGKLLSGEADYSLASSSSLQTMADADEQLSNGYSLRVTPASPSPRTASPMPDHQRQRQNVSPSLSAGSGDSYNVQPTSSSLTDIPDLSAWRISVPFVEFTPTNKQSVTGSQQSIPIYVVSIRRVDFVSEEDQLDEPENDEQARFYMPGDETKRRSWNVRRYLEQFYLLEQKLKERYGDLIDSPLPPKSRVFPILREDRAFYEKRRRLFERFLQSLFEKSELRHSRLLYNFLTTDEGFNQRSPGEGSIGRKLLRTVLVKSESRPLDPFLNGFQQMAEATTAPTSTSFNSKNRHSKRKFESDSESTKSFNIGSTSADGVGPVDDSPLFPTKQSHLYGDNAESLLQSMASTTDIYSAASHPVHLYDLISSLAVDFLSSKAATSSLKTQAFSCLIDPAASITSFLLRDSVEPLLQSRFQRMMLNSLSEDRVAGWIKTLTESMSPVPPPPDDQLKGQLKDVSTWNDYFAQRDETYAAMTKIAGVPDDIAGLIVDTLQEPVANKQLLYMLLDIVVEELFPSQMVKPPQQSESAKQNEAK